MTSAPVYRKQEQEPASDEVIEAAPGVLRMQLPISLPGLGHVNCYALVDGDGVVLVDPGLPGAESWAALTARLAQAEIPIERVHTVVVTHSHPDHFGGSAQLREVAGAEVLTHESFRSHVVEANEDIDADIGDLPDEAILALWKQRYDGITPWGTHRQPIPDEAILRYVQMGDHGGRRFLTPEATVRVADGAPLRFAGRDWFALHTPGHTHDHLCLWDPTEGILLSGDHVLPTITPHIAGSTEVEDPLATFFASLDRIAALDGVRTVLPAHGHPFDDCAGRCIHIKEHHDERLDVLRQAADATGDAPVTEWMKVLFRKRSWGDMAASETFAHLEHLRMLGEAHSRRDADGLVHFALTASA